MLHVCMKRVTCIHIIDLQRPLYGAINFNQDRLSPTSKYFVSDCQALSTGVSEQQSISLQYVLYAKHLLKHIKVTEHDK